MIGLVQVPKACVIEPGMEWQIKSFALLLDLPVNYDGR